MNIDEFLLQAGGEGPCVAVRDQTASPLTPPLGVELRTIDGARSKAVEEMYDVFAEAWHFPPWFGRNMDAFNDCMRDFDILVNTATGRPQGDGYLTDVTNAQLLLIDQPEVFVWFANNMAFYRDYYRDELVPAAAFGVVLSTPGHHLDAVRQRWLAVGVQVSIIDF